MNGYVAEGPGANFFFEKNGELFTAPQGSILRGITRNTIIDLAREAGISVTEKFFTPAELQGATGAFYTGTATLPVLNELYDSVASGEEARRTIERGTTPNYRQELGAELQEVRESELWATGATVRQLRSKATEKVEA